MLEATDGLVVSQRVSSSNLFFGWNRIFPSFALSGGLLGWS